jgi:PST family polysaccharide transporter
VRAGGGAVFWSACEAVVSAGLSFASAFVVARLVGPAELGVGAAAVAAHVLLWVAVNALFADALVQAPRLGPGAWASAFWASVAAGLLASVAQAALGPLLAGAIGDARLGPMCAVLALPLPLVGAGGAMQGRLTRERRFRALAGRAIAGQGLGTLAGVLAAWHGWGAWALVAQQAVTSGTGALALLAHASVLPRPRLRMREVRPLLAIGAPLMAACLVQTGRYRAFALIVGASAGPAALGQVHVAFRLVDTVRDLMLSALWRLMLPAMARVQHDVHLLQAAVDRMLRVSALVTLPAMGALLLSLGPLVRLLLGPGWEPSARAAAVLALLAGYTFLGFPGGVANVARGRTGAALASQCAGAGATLALVALLRPQDPMQAVLAWAAAQMAVSPYAMRVTARALDASLLRHLRAGWAPLGVTAAAVVGAWLLARALDPAPSPLASLAARLVAELVLYAGLAAAFLSRDLRAAAHAAGVRARAGALAR